MNHKVVVYLSIILLLQPIYGSLASTPYINTRDSDTALQYGKNNKATLRVDNLTISYVYVLEVATNTNASYNISWTAFHTSAAVDYNYAGPLQDIYNNTLTQLELVFIENTTSTIITNYYVTLKQSSSLSAFLEFVGNLAVVFIYILTGVLVFALVIKFISNIV